MAIPPLLNRLALDDALAVDLSHLRDLDRERQLRRVANRRGAIVDTEFGVAVDFSSNDYLGLASDSRLAAAAARVFDTQGTGAAASRLISGNNPEHEALDSQLASFVAAEAALSFSSGYAANVGIIPALVGRGDVIFSDALNHASLIDGCRLSRATVHVYPHADMTALARLLDLHRAPGRRALIVTDGLFSMDGDRAPIAELIDLAHRFDAWTYIDDAHAVGVVGERGLGTASAAGCHGQVDVTVGTLGKAFGAAGAFVYGSETLVQYLINRARSFVFSTAMLPAQAAAAREGLAIAEREPERRDRLWTNVRHLRGGMRSRGIESAATDSGDTHIVPVLLGADALAVRVGDDLARHGFLVGAVRPPTVPEGGARLRITVSAAHTTEQIDGLCEALSIALRK